MMQSLYIRFLELVSAAILQREADASLFAGMDEKSWHKLLDYGNIQHMSALLADAALALPAEVQPPLAVKLSWILMREKVEEANAKLNQEVVNLARDYERIGCPMALLKGQGNALCYPIPNHRTPGDIDAFLYLPGSYDKANEWVKAQGCTESDEQETHHWGFERNGIRVENHRRICGFFGKRKYEQAMANLVREVVDNDCFATCKIDEESIRLLPPTLNIFFVFYHMFHHFETAGVGIRQICDWLMMLRHDADKIDVKAYQAMCKQFDLLKASQIFAQLAVKYLHVSASIFPFDLGRESKLTAHLMLDILQGAHFGFYHEKMRKQPKGFWSGRWHRYKYNTLRIMKFAPIAPHHIYTLPWYRFITRIKTDLDNR